MERLEVMGVRRLEREGLTSRAKAQVMRPAVTHWLVKHATDDEWLSRKLVGGRNGRTVVDEDDPAHHKRHNGLASCDLIEDFGAG